MNNQGGDEAEKLKLIQFISDTLETGLSEEALGAVTDLLRAGVHPDAIIAVVTSLSQSSR